MSLKLYLPVAGVLGVLAAVSLGLWIGGGGASGSGKLEWDLRNKETVMTFAYKAYANATAANGMFYLSKTVLKNSGRGSVKDVRVSYQIPEYISWTTPEVYAELLPGQTVVDLFYPKFPQRVAELTSRTTTTLEAKISWEDTDGSRREEIVKRDFDLRGVNEIEYTSLPASEVVTWYDVFENVELCAAFVTTDDPVVKTFASEVTKFAGGTTAGAGGGVSETVRLMNAFYNYQVASNMHYASAKGVPEKLGDVSSLVQNIRLPREVILNGNGLCIELAILWSAVLEHLGVKTFLVVIPGHAFTVVQDGSQLVPVECTGIGGAGIGGSSSFEDAVKSAQKTLNEAQVAKYLDIQALQAAGIRPPELKPIDSQSVQDALAKRLGGGRRAPTPEPTPQQPTPVPPPEVVIVNPVDPGGGPATPPPTAPAVIPPGFRSWQTADSAVSVAYPATWQVAPALAQLRLSVPWVQLVAQDAVSGGGVEVYYWPGSNDLEEALDELGTLIEDQLGGELTVQGTTPTQVGIYPGVYINGVTSMALGATQWTALFAVTRNGVIGVSAGANALTFAQQQPLLSQIISTVRVR